MICGREISWRRHRRWFMAVLALFPGLAPVTPAQALDVKLRGPLPSNSPGTSRSGSCSSVWIHAIGRDASTTITPHRCSPSIRLNSMPTSGAAPRSFGGPKEILFVAKHTGGLLVADRDIPIRGEADPLAQRQGRRGQGLGSILPEAGFEAGYLSQPGRRPVRGRGWRSIQNPGGADLTILRVAGAIPPNGRASSCLGPSPGISGCL